ncbi:hypothetical protein [Planktothrix sp.]
MNQRWDKVFKTYLSPERGLVNELIEVRNKWRIIIAFQQMTLFGR